MYPSVYNINTCVYKNSFLFLVSIYVNIKPIKKKYILFLILFDFSISFKYKMMTNLIDLIAFFFLFRKER